MKVTEVFTDFFPIPFLCEMKNTNHMEITAVWSLGICLRSGIPILHKRNSTSCTKKYKCCYLMGK